MEAFLIAMRAVMPMALLMGIGAVLRLTGITDRDTMKKVDVISFRLLIPCLMFYNIYNADFAAMKGSVYIQYALGVLAILFVVALTVVPKLEKDPRTAAALGQVIVRPNFIIFGVVVAESIYGKGNVGAVALLGAVTVPVFNAMAAVVLEVGRSGKANLRNLMVSILKNPMVIAAILGVAVNLSGLRLPASAETVVSDLSDMSTPLSFLSLGVSLDVAAISSRIRPLAIGVVGRLILVPGIFMPIAAALGIRGQELTALTIFLAAPAAVAGYPMAVAMGADGELAGQSVIFTTLLSMITIFGWVWVLGHFALV